MAQSKNSNIKTFKEFKEDMDKSPNASKMNIKDMYIPIESYHVSCKSYRPKTLNDAEENLGGLVLYAKDGKTDWYSNGVHCKTGYIILKKTSKEKVKGEWEIYNEKDELEHIECSVGMVHGKIYKSIFNELPTTANVTGSGFARVNGKWKYNSISFNSKDDKYHTDHKTMKELEAKWVQKAMENWILYGKQNTYIKESDGGGMVLHETIGYKGKNKNNKYISKGKKGTSSNGRTEVNNANYNASGSGSGSGRRNSEHCVIL